jgi:membrane associated rhomboid family serine protease
MMTLFFFAPVVEEQMGAPYLLILYAITALGADLAVYAMHYKNPRYACLGASGSVSGVLFGAIVLRPEMNLYLMLLPIPIPAPLFAVGYIALSFYLAHRGGDGISHEAHIGGALAGLALTAVLSPTGLDPLIERIWPG